ncbi:MAG: macro domain-containing protein [Actinomycetia bacterium]|nr:macro domain-containing protein [Actinomycetes bacterium]MCP5034162.1 macro domain-containing protein [Actinomycetes bacterium]
MKPVPIEYVVGDATAPVGGGNKIIAHICNDIGGWGLGFVLALSNRWNEPEQAYYGWYQERASNDFELGSIQLIAVEPDIWVANIIGQRGIHPGPDGPPVRYDAIEVGLNQLADEAVAMDATIHMPRIGCGLAGGDWTVVEGIITRTLSDAGVQAVVYDLET